MAAVAEDCPDELVLAIAGFLERFKDLVAMSGACVRWRRALFDECALWRRFGWREPLFDEGLPAFTAREQAFAQHGYLPLTCMCCGRASARFDEAVLDTRCLRCARVDLASPWSYFSGDAAATAAPREVLEARLRAAWGSARVARAQRWAGAFQPSAGAALALPLARFRRRLAELGRLRGEEGRNDEKGAEGGDPSPVGALAAVFARDPVDAEATALVGALLRWTLREALLPEARDALRRLAGEEGLEGEEGFEGVPTGVPTGREPPTDEALAETLHGGLRPMAEFVDATRRALRRRRWLAEMMVRARAPPEPPSQHFLLDLAEELEAGIGIDEKEEGGSEEAEEAEEPPPSWRDWAAAGRVLERFGAAGGAAAAFPAAFSFARARGRRLRALERFWAREMRVGPWRPALPEGVASAFIARGARAVFTRLRAARARLWALRHLWRRLSALPAEAFRALFEGASVGLREDSSRESSKGSALIALGLPLSERGGRCPSKPSFEALLMPALGLPARLDDSAEAAAVLLDALPGEARAPPRRALGELRLRLFPWAMAQRFGGEAAFDRRFPSVRDAARFFVDPRDAAGVPPDAAAMARLVAMARTLEEPQDDRAACAAFLRLSGVSELRWWGFAEAFRATAPADAAEPDHVDAVLAVVRRRFEAQFDPNDPPEDVWEPSLPKLRRRSEFLLERLRLVLEEVRSLQEEFGRLPRSLFPARAVRDDPAAERNWMALQIILHEFEESASVRCGRNPVFGNLRRYWSVYSF